MATAPSSQDKWHPTTDGPPGVAPMTRGQYAEAYDGGYAYTKRYLLSRGIGVDTAEEMAQAAWAKGWEHRRQLRNPDAIAIWVNSIAMNLFRKLLRRHETAELPLDIPVAPRSGSEAVDLARALSSCSRADAELLNRFYGEGYTSQELAAELGCTASAIRVRLLRLRRRLQRLKPSRYFANGEAKAAGLRVG